jgi:hypothetical protein
VILQHDRQFILVRLKVGYRVLAFPAGAARELDAIMDEDVIVKNGKRRLPNDLLAFENRPMENNVIRLSLVENLA